MQIEIRTEQFFIVRCYLSPHEDSLATVDELNRKMLPPHVTIS